MSYVVTWWKGETRQSVARKDEESAQKVAVNLRARSDACADKSLVPIRMMSQDVHDRMQALVKAQNNTRCKHGLLRWCVKCLSSVS